MTTSERELNFRAKKTSEKISENVHIVANDPSLAFFRIQEHVRKVLPPLLEKRSEVLRLQNNLQGHCYDMEYALSAVKNIEGSESILRNIQEIAKSSVFLKQQLKFEDGKNKSKRESSRNSMYKRFSAHLTLDFPELPDFSGAMRDTGYMMETIMTTNRREHNVQQNSVGELQRSHTTLH
ncbi:BLOC-1-related complex subunit 8 homolog [Teleopsis dalmanni]|uniref:BLOC-1-related complex subunit 8 homolog n=1 Tax=Teleopsis dalmanni TaxID=139649 RepID=UPI000D32A2E1|nr:BLOC-1-related complex subunit 8 homolog [Teleopsis dalmanni]